MRRGLSAPDRFDLGALRAFAALIGAREIKRDEFGDIAQALDPPKRSRGRPRKATPPIRPRRAGLRASEPQ
jgi:hypothetical protein